MQSTEELKTAGTGGSSRTNSDYQKLREITEVDHQFFLSDLDIFDLRNAQAPYSLERCLDLQMLIRMLSRNKRSVQTARTILDCIFTVRDVELLAGDSVKQLDCIASKFKLLHDLSITLKVPVQDLLRYSSDEICGKITYFLILCGDTLSVLDYYVTFEFYLAYMLPRSWYFLLTTQKITHERLQETLLRLKYKDRFIITLIDIKNNLYECIVQIAYTQKMTYSQKKNLLQMVKSTFGFQNEQELINLYNSASSKTGFFESKLLINLMKRLSFGKKYFLEKLIAKNEKEKTLQYYIKKHYMSNEFYKKGDQTNRKVSKFVDALDFINKELKKNNNVQHSDFAVAFLNTFNTLFPEALKEQDPMRRQNRLVQFILTVELLIKKNIVEDEYFKAAIVNMTIFVLKMGIESDETVDISVFSMQILLNAIGLKDSMPYLSKFCSIAVQAYLKFPDKQKIKKYTSKILNFYIVEKIRFTQIYFKDLQFLLLKKIQEMPSLKDSISIISQHLYSSPDSIAENLKYLVRSLQTGNEDIRLLNTTYILELLEQSEHNSVRKVIVSQDILKIVYQGILEMPQDYKQEKSRKLSIICAKCVASIGLCQSFVNDPLTLKATNQTTLVGKKRELLESQKLDEDAGNPGLMKSDFYNPLTNIQKYKSQQQDNTLELLTIPSLNDLQIERENVIHFAQELLKKIGTMTNLTDQKPQNFYYAQFLIDMFINHQKTLNPEGGSHQQIDEQIKEKYAKQQQISKSIQRFSPCDLSEYTQFFDPAQPSQATSARNNRRLCLHLITKIEEKSWRELFEACVPIIKSSNETLEMLLPYIIYYALRFNTSDIQLPYALGQIMNKILESEYVSQIVPILKAQDFIKICDQQDKRLFKAFIENETKFKYVEKLFKIEYDISKAKDQNVVNFIKTIDQNVNIKHSFQVVKKIEILLTQIDKQLKIQGAQKVKAFQRCVYNFEESYRATAIQQKNSQAGFLDLLSSDESIEIVNLHRQLNPEDFDYGIFNSIIGSYKSQMQHLKNFQDQMLIEECKTQDAQQADRIKKQQSIKNLYSLYTKRQIGEHWKNGQWDLVQEWAQGIDLASFDSSIIFLDRELDNPISKFEFLIALFLSEYTTGIKKLLTSDENMENSGYLTSLGKVNHFFELLYHEFILSLDQLQGEISYYYKLFLHVLYEIETFVHFIKDTLFLERNKINEALKKETNKEKRRFDKIFLDFDMTSYFEKLLAWLEERSQLIQNSTESLKLIYFVRRSLFKLFDRENEYAFYLMKLARLYRKSSNDVLEVNRLFKECEQYAHKIIDYELEYAKYTLKTKNAHEAYQYLMLKHDAIKEKCEHMFKANRIGWMPQRVHEKAVLLSIELQIKIDPQNPQIMKRFDEFLKHTNKTQWEKPVFRYAQYLDELENKGLSLQMQTKDDPQNDPKKRAIQKIYYYISSLKYGYKYIWQSFPRALELWFEFNDKETDTDKINNFMRTELYRLEIFKLASVLQILLSRYSHQKEVVRDIIMLVLSKIANAYPGQCAWWIFNFLHFDSDNASTTLKKQLPVIKTCISRQEFAKQLLGKIMSQNEQVYKKIMECEKIFLELRKLTEKAPPEKMNSNTMELPQSLQKISASQLVMPIEENLSPQLPSLTYKINQTLNCLLSTTGQINIFNPSNTKRIQANVNQSNDEPMQEGNDSETVSLSDFPAFKARPVLISGFLNEATIMVSKEKPKKIGIIGSNKQVYNFLLKCDKYGDLRKEQRFIDFAVLCNKMLENDSESRKRNLRLRTYAIVPLTRSTGMIEWIQNTATLKSIVGEQWKRHNIKGEMHDIKQKAITLKQGETHEQIWDKVKEEIKPVLGNWMSDHFPSPEIWYEARINFIRSTAIWSMIGYVIGLGDRHGDNILIHQHTGEVTHVDFDCIFEKGAKLKIPEIVPFRLTQNIMDAFGIFKEKGVFQRNCEVVQRVLRKNSKNIISFLDSFIHDPLIESQQNIKVEIKQALDIVKAKLHGQIKGDQIVSVTVEEQVEQVVLNAMYDDSLRKMYIGWMPWL